MTAQGQCDQPHVRFEHQPRGPANASIHWSEDLGEIDTHATLSSPRRTFVSISNAASSDESKEGSLGSPFALNPPLPCSPLPPPSNSTLLSPTDTSPSIMFSTLADHPANSLLMQNFDDRITSLERAVCSNFVCCGVHLADFHALIDHFEEKHVSVVTPAGKKLYPPRGFRSQSLRPQSAVSESQQLSCRPEPPKIDTSVSSPSPSSTTFDSTASTPASSRSSSVVASPTMPMTPLSPPQFTFDSAAIVLPLHSHSHSHDAPSLLEYNPYMGLTAMPQPQLDENSQTPYSIEVISAFGPEYDFSRDYACYESAFEKRRKAAEAETQAELERQLQMQLQLQFELQDDIVGVNERHEEHVPEVSVPGELPISSSTSMSKKASANSRMEPTVVVDQPATNNGGKVIKAKSKTSMSGLVGAPGVGRKREKAYKCPHQGCTKAYLNPNGLKYHLEKGTCKFEDPVPGQAPDSSSASSTSASSTSSEAQTFVSSAATTNSNSFSYQPSNALISAGTPSVLTASSPAPYIYAPQPVYGCAAVPSYDGSNESNSLSDVSNNAGNTVSSSGTGQESMGVLDSVHVASDMLQPASRTVSSLDGALSQDKLTQHSRFAAVYSHHLYIQSLGPSTSSL